MPVHFSLFVDSLSLFAGARLPHFGIKKNLAGQDLRGYCGERGIRTLGTVSRTHAFQACSLSHSDTSPFFKACKSKNFRRAAAYFLNPKATLCFFSILIRRPLFATLKKLSQKIFTKLLALPPVFILSAQNSNQS